MSTDLQYFTDVPTCYGNGSYLRVNKYDCLMQLVDNDTAGLTYLSVTSTNEYEYEYVQ